MPLEIGADFDRYRLEALVGQGGMGRVYRAYDARLRRRVALKVLQTTEVDDAIDPERVLREARAAAALDHPGVVAIFDVGAAEGHSFIAMEYVVGRSLRTMIGADAAPISERLRWLVEVARSLAAAHRAGLVHRDIKPENVMVREDGVVKLLDFGIARLSDPHTPVLEDSLGARRSARDESTVAGTPSYMAPEQAQRRRVDARADQFSWGVLAYELLSGALPWRSVLDGVPPSVAVITERPAPLDAAALDLPTLVAEVIGRALEKAPERRFPTMDALVAALEDDGPMWLSDAPGGEVGHPTIPEGGTTRAMTPPPHPAGRRVRPRTLGLVGVALAGVTSIPVLWNMTHREGASTASTAAPDDATAPAGAPDPWRPSAPAERAFAEGLARLHDASLNAGLERFDEALEYEPGYASAHLRYAFIALIDGPYPAPAEPFHAATQLRARLDPRERAFLDAIAPAFDLAAADPVELVRRVSDVALRYPDDLEIGLYRAMALAWANHDREAKAALRQLLARDPKSATSWYLLAYIAGRANELDEARADIERCLELAPDAIDCLWLRIKLNAYTGRCAEMNADARRWQALKANDHGAAIAQVHALIALESDNAAIDAAEEAAAASMSVTLHTVARRFHEASRRLLAGEFSAADQILETLPIEAGFTVGDRLRLTEWRVALREEIGDPEGAAAIAGDLRLRKGSLPSSGYLMDDGILADISPMLDAVLAGVGAIDRDEQRARREAWLSDWRRRGAHHHERELWLRGYAEPARTPAEAREALARLSSFGGVRRFAGDHLLIVDAARVYLLAGRATEATELLREAVRSCLAALEPIRVVQAHALLGQSLEATGDRAGACAAYEQVLRRWRGAQPRSRTAEDVAARTAALGCELHRISSGG